MEKTQKAYNEIIEVLNKHRDLCVYDISDLESKAKKHIFGLRLVEEYGLKLDPRNVQSLDYIRFGDYRAIGWWGEKYRREVSWSDDGKQPDDEFLFSISFSTGPYIFGYDYPKELFKEFWQELKNYNPKYCDTTNHCMYFSIESCSKVFNEFDNIIKKYYEKNKEDFKLRKIKKMEEDLLKLKTNK
jgi:hypothetical protein